MLQDNFFFLIMLPKKTDCQAEKNFFYLSWKKRSARFSDICGKAELRCFKEMRLCSRWHAANCWTLSLWTGTIFLFHMKQVWCLSGTEHRQSPSKNRNKNRNDLPVFCFIIVIFFSTFLFCTWAQVVFSSLSTKKVKDTQIAAALKSWDWRVVFFFYFSHQLARVNRFSFTLDLRCEENIHNSFAVVDAFSARVRFGNTRK